MATAHDWSPRAAAYAASRAHSAGPSLEKVALLASARAGDRVLDIGAGAGHTAALLAATGATVVALDQAEGMLAAARQRYSHLPGLSFHHASAESSGLEESSFDIVTARHTLHHHLDVRATLAEVRRLLRPGGRFVLADETAPAPSVDDWFQALERARDTSHVRTYALAEWRSLLAESGLRWVVGDDLTRYHLNVEAWFDRTGLGTAERAAIQESFRAAPEQARQLFAVEYDPITGDALAFEMPVALILALRAEEEQ